MRQEEYAVKDKYIYTYIGRERAREKAKKNRRVKTAAFNPAKEQELDLLTGESVRGFVCACVWLCNRWRAEEWRARGLTWPSNGLAASPLLGSCTLRAGIRYVPPYVFFTCLSLSPTPICLSLFMSPIALSLLFFLLQYVSYLASF